MIPREDRIYIWILLVCVGYFVGHLIVAILRGNFG